MASRRFSHAIAEGDGISVVAAVEDADAARAAEAQRAEALVVNGDPARLREATRLPILWRADAAVDRAAEGADAVTVALPEDEDDDHGPARRRHEEAVAAGPRSRPVAMSPSSAPHTARRPRCWPRPPARW